MRTLGLLTLILTLTACTATSANPQAALARAGYQPTARAALDGSPGQTGPQEIIGVFVPAGPFALKAGVIWDGNPLTITPPPLGAQAAPAVAPADCADTAQGYWEWHDQ